MDRVDHAEQAWVDDVGDAVLVSFPACQRHATPSGGAVG
jgi:hypothetical protein